MTIDPDRLGSAMEIGNILEEVEGVRRRKKNNGERDLWRSKVGVLRGWMASGMNPSLPDFLFLPFSPDHFIPSIPFISLLIVAFPLLSSRSRSSGSNILPAYPIGLHTVIAMMMSIVPIPC